MSDIDKLLDEVREYFKREPNCRTHLNTLFAELDKRISDGELPNDWAYHECPRCNMMFKSVDFAKDGTCIHCFDSTIKEKVIRDKVQEYERSLRYPNAKNNS